MLLFQFLSCDAQISGSHGRQEGFSQGDLRRVRKVTVRLRKTFFWFFRKNEMLRTSIFAQFLPASHWCNDWKWRWDRLMKINRAWRARATRIFSCETGRRGQKIDFFFSRRNPGVPHVNACVSCSIFLPRIFFILEVKIFYAKALQSFDFEEKSRF